MYILLLEIRSILTTLFTLCTFLHAYESVGTDSTIDVLSWNIENFAKDDATRPFERFDEASLRTNDVAYV